eukprot:Sspe_Gene.112635::Locus_95759_Transcript_1_1_Confidence_1.000_Length_1053::g.112635::m.112635
MKAHAAPEAEYTQLRHLACKPSSIAYDSGESEVVIGASSGDVYRVSLSGEEAERTLVTDGDVVTTLLVNSAVHGKHGYGVAAAGSASGALWIYSTTRASTGAEASRSNYRSGLPVVAIKVCHTASGDWGVACLDEGARLAWYHLWKRSSEWVVDLPDHDGIQKVQLEVPTPSLSHLLESGVPAGSPPCGLMMAANTPYITVVARSGHLWVVSPKGMVLLSGGISGPSPSAITAKGEDVVLGAGCRILEMKKFQSLTLRLELPMQCIALEHAGRSIVASMISQVYVLSSDLSSVIACCTPRACLVGVVGMDERRLAAVDVKGNVGVFQWDVT